MSELKFSHELRIEALTRERDEAREVARHLAHDVCDYGERIREIERQCPWLGELAAKIEEGRDE